MEWHKAIRWVYLCRKTYREERQMNFLNTTGLIKYINPLNAIIYFIIINLIGFVLMYIDKKRAKYGRWRIPEKTLFIITALGGGLGTIAGMYTFRHKTQKIAFVIGFPAITILEIICIIYFTVIK